MPLSDLFLPAMALMGWTFAVLLIIPYRRFQAVFAGRVSAKDFKVGECANVPPEVSIPNRVYMNLLEAPVLFYAVCFIAYLTHNLSPGLVGLTWVYFALRVAHSLIYLTYNHVFHRFLAFAASNVVLVIMWAGLLRDLLH